MTKFKVTALQRQNALYALNVFWPSVHPDKVLANLLRWRAAIDDTDTEAYENAEDFAVPPGCGTVACFGGWCEWAPLFREQLGLDPKAGEMAISQLHDLFGAPRKTDWRADDSGFNGHGIFAERGHFPSDAGFEGNDHELVSHRLQWFIDNSEVVS